MSEPTFPFGYAGSPQGMGTMLTRAQCEAKQTVAKLHPEMWRRTIAMMELAHGCGVPLGVGEGWRVQPYPPPPGFADPGNSNHEGFPADGTSGGAVAIDMVPDVSWDWMEGYCATYGLRTFRDVNDEPWHIQPAEIPASRNWRTEPWQLEAWPIPGDQQEDAMALSDDDYDEIARRVWAYKLAGDDLPEENKAAGWRLRQAQGTNRYYLGAWKDTWPNPDQSLLKEIAANVEALLALLEEG